MNNTEIFEKLITEGKGGEFLTALSKSIDLDDKEVKEKYVELAKQWKKNQDSKAFGYLDEEQSIYSFQSVYKRNKEWITNSIVPVKNENTVTQELNVPVVVVNNVSKDEFVLRRKVFVGVLYIVGGLILFSPFFYPSSAIKATVIGNQILPYQPSLMEVLWDGGRLVVGVLHIFIGIWYLIVPYGKVTKDTLEINDVFSKSVIKLSDIIRTNGQLYYKRRRLANKKLVLRQVQKQDVNKLNKLLA